MGMFKPLMSKFVWSIKATLSLILLAAVLKVFLPPPGYFDHKNKEDSPVWYMTEQ